jgi:hypothetical protein
MLPARMSGWRVAARVVLFCVLAGTPVLTSNVDGPRRGWLTSHEVRPGAGVKWRWDTFDGRAALPVTPSHSTK